MTVRISMALATSHLGPLLDITRAAEEAGLDRVWTTEGFGGDGIVRAGHLVAHTSRIGIGTGIAYSFTRAPLAVAMAAADLAELSGGRFALGLGAGTRGVRTRRFDAAGYDHPAPRTAEYAELVRAALRSEGGLRFEGRFYQCDFPQLDMPQDAALRAGVPLYAAALNPVMLRAAARSCDGIALHSLATAPAYLRDVVAPAVAGPDRPKLAAWKICVVDDDPAAAADAVRRQLAFYFSTPSYHPVLAGTPWTEVAQRIRDLATELRFRDWGPVAALVPDDMVAAYSVAGDRDSCAEQIAATAGRFAAAGVDELVLQLTSGGTPQQTRANGLALVAAVQHARSERTADAHL
ncbi:LLM class flavin-dependent oxidoreductase [Dactylosporangium sp. NPDC006015]|uniref:LLM class flavin-dependent oxidoreductase n=1 Tax=Dactylosporangium sp. NPDC006015 TaxID=3154576 RepID=UPI0033A50764